MAIPNIGAVTADGAPVARIMEEQLGATVEKLFLVFICISIFACGMIIMMTGSRVIFAMGRDGRFPASGAFGRVSPRWKTPLAATALVLGWTR